MGRFLNSKRASLVIAAHNEGERLLRTVQSSLETTLELPCEVLVVDDASQDGSVEELRRGFPEVRVVSNRDRLGGPAAKDLGGRKSRGKVIVFLDGHCKPEPWAIVRLINDVEDLNGDAIVTPRVPALDCELWENKESQVGHGYRLRLEDFDCQWMGLRKMRPRDRFYECPALIGCCFAISRKLYRRLKGFDRDMLEWGVEDLDLGLKAWLMGSSILHDPDATIGHRFQRSFGFSVSREAVLVNQMRMAFKNFSDGVWNKWLENFSSRHDKKVWDAAWERFQTGRVSAEREREYLLTHRVHDEFWYAERFDLDWP